MKLYPFPEPRLHLRVPDNGIPADHKHPERFWDFSTMVIRWMGRNALRRLRDHELTGRDFPDVGTLSNWLQEVTIRAGKRWIGTDRLPYDKVPFMTADAAQYALDHYSQDFYDRASKGGRKSKRGPEFTEEMLALVEGKSITEQAELLNCHPSTISRLRKRLAQQPDADDLILAQLDAEAAAARAEASTVEDLHETQTPSSIHETDRTPEPVIEPEALEAPADSIPETKLQLSPLPDFEAMRRAEETERAARIPQDAFLDLMADPDPQPEYTFTSWPTAVEDITPDIDIEALFKDGFLAGAAA